LGEVFPGGVRLVPGDRVVILASEGPLTVDPAVLSAGIVRRGLETTYVSPAMLPFRLDRARVERLERTLASAGREAVANRDLAPVSTYFQAQLWAGQFAGPGRGLLDAAAEAGPFWLLDLPLVAAAVVLLVLALVWGRSPSRALVPVAVMGFTTIVVEVSLLIAFQANFGYVYGKVPLLLAAFMTGLVAGGSLGRRRKRPGRTDLPLVQAGFVLLLAATCATLPGTGGEAVPFALLGLYGLLGGFLFVSASRRLTGDRPHPGLAYGIDLTASFAGAVLAAALIIPLFGIPALVLRLAVLNVLCGLFLLVPARPA
jgi:spermidine synthase